MALKGEGCLGKAADDEPVFVLRARDIYAPSAVRAWALQLGPGIPKPTTKQEAIEYEKKVNPKFKEAMEVANTMADWQRINGSKTPD